jgi:hypothetical protein
VEFKRELQHEMEMEMEMPLFRVVFSRGMLGKGFQSKPLQASGLGSTALEWSLGLCGTFSDIAEGSGKQD